MIQLFLLKYLIKWISKICDYSDEIKEIVGFLVTKNYDKQYFKCVETLEWYNEIEFENYRNKKAENFGEYILLENTETWKGKIKKNNN